MTRYSASYVTPGLMYREIVNKDDLQFPCIEASYNVQNRSSRVKTVGRTWIAGFSPNECWVRENFVLYRAVPYEKVWASARETRTHVSGLSRSRFRSSFYTKRKEPTRTFFETPPSVAVSTYFAFIVSKTCHPHATSEIPPSIWTEIEVWLNDPFHSTAFDETALLCDPRDCLNISKLIKLAE